MSLKMSRRALADFAARTFRTSLAEVRKNRQFARDLPQKVILIQAAILTLRTLFSPFSSLFRLYFVFTLFIPLTLHALPMQPLRIAVLWHQHQPYYKKDKDFIMPWVRLHATKDYVDVPAILEDFPSVKQTFNLVPSLLLQLQDYVSGAAEDNVQRLTNTKAEDLSTAQKQEIIQCFFLCNVDKMVLPFPRYRELYERSRNAEEAVARFTAQDWRDLQVWYNLTWIGPVSRRRASIESLFIKGAGFSEADKAAVMQAHKDILADVVAIYKRLHARGQVEISVSPKFHPILPLLCDTLSARESMPHTPLPDRFRFPQDADHQIRSGIDLFKGALGHAPKGMWPSEGSVSDEALSLMVNNGLRWAATDEQILHGTMGSDYFWLDRYFAHTARTATGEISMLFRDHNLSDAIGFVYSNWSAFDAAANFRERLLHIRRELIAHRGEECLQHAVVPIILDGENCWEYYDQNGEPFLRHFFRELSEHPELTTITCDEAAASKHSRYSRSFNHIYAGSWINHNFRIWIGHDEDNRAWNMLRGARELVERKRTVLPQEALDDAMDALYVAEGSDWFWWYGDEHVSANQADFDFLFRWYVQEAYRICGEEPPANTFTPIIKSGKQHLIIPQRGDMQPTIDGKVSSEEEWQHAGYYDAVLSGGAMHQAADIFKRIYFGQHSVPKSGTASQQTKPQRGTEYDQHRDEDMLFFRCDINRRLLDNEQIELYFIAPKQVSIKQSPSSLTIQTYVSSGVPTTFPNCSFAYSDVFELSVPRSFVFSPEDRNADGTYTLKLRVHVTSQTGTNIYPTQGSLELVFEGN
jgi:alpha-amylase/alpha-mannosidase (GH57 family)